MILARRAAAVLLIPAAAFCHEPITTKLTWSREISRLFVKRCMSCHQAGGKAPFALTNYDEARPWAVAIREEVSNRTMPPWGAVRGFGDFQQDPSLTGEEIQLVIDWVNGGAPEGDRALVTTELPKSWQPVAAKGSPVVFRGSTVLPRRVSILGLRVRKASKDADSQVVLERPDGEVEPLLWLRSPDARFPHDYVLVDAVDAPAGSRVRSYGSAVTWALITAPPVPARKSAGLSASSRQ